MRCERKGSRTSDVALTSIYGSMNVAQYSRIHTRIATGPDQERRSEINAPVGYGVTVLTRQRHKHSENRLILFHMFRIYRQKSGRNPSGPKL